MSIYTIGYGGRSTEDVLALLKQYEIEFLIDVRSRPYSRYYADFTKKNLPGVLANVGIRYVFMGDVLGGMPDDPACYDADGHVDYQRLAATERYQAGIARLKDALSQGLRVALMCAERNPARCHRSKLIGETLREAGIVVQHIDARGALKSQEDVMAEARSGDDSPAQLSLFEE